MTIFNYDFMQRAFIVGILLATIIPSIGLIVVLKRLSMMGDALSHASLAGVAGGLVLGINPILGSVIVTIAAAFSIEAIRKKIPRFSEIAIAIVMSAGIGIAAILSGFIKNSVNFNSFLFGSIVSISDFEMLLIVIVSIIVMLTSILLYKELLYISLDEGAAKLSGVPIKKIGFVFTLLTAMTIAIAARTIGALIVSSLMVIPVACAMQVAKSYRQTLVMSIVFAQIFTIAGLFLSYYARLKPGGTIVLLGVITLVFMLIVKQVRIKHKSHAKT